MMNLHNHTRHSGGSFTVDEIVAAAERGGLEYVGICDTYGSSVVKSIAPDGLEDYINDVKRASAAHPNIRVLAGVEIDSCEDHTDFAALPYETFNRLDFVLYEYVQDEQRSGMSFFELMNERRKLSVPIGLAHNDIAVNFAEVNHDNLLSVLESDCIFVELNDSPLHFKLEKPFYIYADVFFRKLRMTNVMLSIGTDTHDRIDEVCAVSESNAFVDRMAMRKNLITKLWPKKVAQ